MWYPNDGFTGTRDHVVIPAKAGIQPGKPGFRIKSGMTDNVKLLLRHYTRNRRWGSFWSGGKPRNSLAGEAGFTLPFVIVLIGVSLTIIAAVTLLDSHFRSIAKAGDGERMYYALDSAVESVMADLVRGADAASPSYTPSPVTLNEITPSINITAPATGAAPSPTQQYFDPGFRNPNLLDMPGNKAYLVHILNVRPGLLVVNWAFDISVGGPTPQADFTLRVLKDAASQTPGRVNGCPTGTVLADTTKQFQAAGSYNLASGAVNITQPGVYSVAFCVVTLTHSNMTTRAFKPTGALTDTWVYGVAYKDYQITASAGGASVTAYVRQMPGPTQPPTGNWAANNISWITNLVTPHEWGR